MAKICTACLIPKAPQAFYCYASGTKMAMCKECHCIAVSENRAAKREHYLAYLREYNKRPERMAAKKAYAISEACRANRRVCYRFRKLVAQSECREDQGL